MQLHESGVSRSWGVLATMLLSNGLQLGREMRPEFPGLVRSIMHKERITKTQLRDAKVIRKCTWRCFDARLDSGEISVAEMERILEYLGVNRVKAILALVCLKSVEEYFEPSCETVAMLAQDLIIKLTQQIILFEGNFETLKAALCTSIAERQVIDIIEHQRRIRDVQLRGFGAGG